MCLVGALCEELWFGGLAFFFDVSALEPCSDEYVLSPARQVISVSAAQVLLQRQSITVAPPAMPCLHG